MARLPNDAGVVEERELRRDPILDLARPVPVDLAKLLLVAVVYYVAARLSLRVALVGRNVTPVWPPTGIALVAFLILGRRFWPAVAVAAFLVNAPITPSLTAAAATAAGNTAAPLVAATLLRRVGFRPQLDRLLDAASLVALAALLSMLISATVGAGTLLASGAIDREAFPGAWAVWWAGDAMGVLIVAPFLLTLRRAAVRTPMSWNRWVEAAALVTLLVGATLFVVTTEWPVLFAVLPFLGWAAWRFQQRAAAPAALFVSSAATWAAVTGRGPFATGDLVQKMLILQLFNAAVAFTSFFFAALVAERLRDRTALADWAAELESAVARRTTELTDANERLGAEVDERRRVEGELRRSERQLAEAQEVARIGSWEWDLETGAVTWSDEMYRMHGASPQEFPVTFDKAIELVEPEDRARIQDNIRRAFERGQRALPDIDYRIVLPDRSVRALFGRARAVYDDDGRPIRMLGTVQDVTERREYEREHHIAETLQRALLPKDLPRFREVDMTGRYVPAEIGLTCGGDWYDVVPLADGSVGVVIGDVSGHGLEAAGIMGELRFGLRAFAVEGHSPAGVVARVDAMLQRMHPEMMCTLVYARIDVGTRVAHVVGAGHPPPLVLHEDGTASFLDVAPRPPLGVDPDPVYEATEVRLEPGSTFVLYTDGLVDRHDLPLTDGLDRLVSAATEAAGSGAGALCDAILDRLVTADVSDDVAILAAEFVRDRAVAAFDATIAADASELAELRRDLTSWLGSTPLSSEEIGETVLAASEASANAIEHAYVGTPGAIDVSASFGDATLEVVVRDHGRWRPPRTDDRGRGLTVMRACMDEVVVSRTDDGTEVRMRRALEDRRDDGVPDPARRAPA
jgi:PAS domain S-box-containing protein